MKSRIDGDFWLLTRPCAHRGYHNIEVGVAENSKTAFIKAIEKNYPIEMDVQMTKDGKLVVFHDDNLKRITGENSLIWDKNYDEIKDLKLSGTQDTIMTFSEFLNLIDGKVPLLIEIKSQREKGIEQKVVDELKNYKGEFVVQSFDPRIMIKIKKLAPNIIRGILATQNAEVGSKFKEFILKNMSLNFLVKPDFINYDLTCLPLKKRLVKNLPLICWTVRTEDDKKTAKKYAKSYVFENLDL